MIPWALRSWHNSSKTSQCEKDAAPEQNQNKKVVDEVSCNIDLGLDCILRDAGVSCI